MRHLQKSLGFTFLGLLFLATHAPAYQGHEESRNGPYLPGPQVRRAVQPVAPQVRVRRGPCESVQVNIDAEGNNILGDAANEPSIAIDPTDPNKIVIGWRQFDTVASDFRQTGWAYSHDGGKTWAFPGTLRPGIFGSDPVLAANADGVFYYLSLSACDLRLFRSFDGGVSWGSVVQVVDQPWDKPWMSIDRTDGIGRGHVYVHHGLGFARSTDEGATFSRPKSYPLGLGDRGTQSVGPKGELYITGVHGTGRSDDAQDALVEPTFERVSRGWDAPHGFGYSSSPNPGGLLGQPWIAAAPPRVGNQDAVYVLFTSRALSGSTTDISFSKSPDRAKTWETVVRVNDDPADYGAWHWFGTMSVAPNGRIDAVWNDTRNTCDPYLSELHYAYSLDQGTTWSVNVAVGPEFDSRQGWPGGQDKIGDYYHSISDDTGVNVAYAATYHGEQDVYFLRIQPFDCNDNGVDDTTDLAQGGSKDCNVNGIPDECDTDCNGNGIADECDLRDGIMSDANANFIGDECERKLFVNADTWNVGNGSSWPTAFSSLQTAISAARTSGAPVTEIWVAAGTYKPGQPGDEPVVTFRLVPGVSIYGGFAGYEASIDDRNPERFLTILSCDLNDDDETHGTKEDNCYHVITAARSQRITLLDGLVITGGNADPAPENDNGGGLLNLNGNLGLHRCTFVGNRGLSGGGIYNGGCLSATACTFTDNHARAFGGALFNVGEATVIGCSFVENVTNVSAGAVGSGTQAGMTLRNCQFVHNASQFGGAIQAASALVDGCTFVGNKAANLGAAIRQRSNGVIRLTNSIVWANSAPGADLYTAQLTPHLGSIQVSYTCVQGWTPVFGGTGNIALDPQLVDLAGSDGLFATGDEDLHLGPTSPCINAGNPEVSFDAGEVDLDGHPRVLCHWLDMGAYEFGIGDVTCNGRVDLLDHISWSPCATGPESGPSKFTCESFDFDADGDIDLRDFAGFQRVFLGD